MRIYIAYPYTENPVENTKFAEEVGIQLIRMGHAPYIPHKHTFGWEKRDDINYDDFIRFDLEWLGVCDAILFLGESRGTLIELERAKELGLKIFRRLEEIEVISDGRL